MNRLWNLPGVIGLLFASGVGIVTGVLAWQKPFNRSDYDFVWAIATISFLSVTGLTFRFKGGRFLIWLTGLIVGVTVLFTILFGGKGFVFFVLLWWAAIAFGLGNFLLKRFFGSLELNQGERILLALGLGFGGSIVFIFIAAVLDVLYPIVIYSMFIGLTFFMLSQFVRSDVTRIKNRMRDLWRRWSTQDLTLESIVLASVSLCLLGSLIWALSPAIQHDALRYHLGAPVLYIQHHGLIEIAEDHSTYYAHNGEMLYTLALLLAGQPLPSLLHFTFCIFTAALTYVFARDVVDRSTAVLATLLFLSLPLVTWQSGTADIDMILTFYTLGSTSCVYKWWRQNQGQWLTLSGIFAGLALGTKLNAVLVIVPLFTLAFFGLWFRTRSARSVIGGMLRLNLPAFILFAPWLVREFVWTGNPIFPYFFGTPQEYGSYSGRTPDKGVSVMIDRAGKWNELLDFLRFPWELSVRLFDESTPRGRLAGITLLALPWFYLRRSSPLKVSATLALLALGTCFLWNFMSDVSRYLLPVLPVFSILGAMNICVLLQQISNHRRRKQLRAAVLILGFCYLAATRLTTIAAGWAVPERFPYKVALGFETQTEFLSRNLPIYGAYRFLEQQKAEKVLSIGNDLRVYTTARIYGVMGSSYLRHYLASLPPAQQLLNMLHQLGFDFLLVDLNLVNTFYEPEFFQVSAIDESFLSRFTKMEFANKNVYVYRLLEKEKPATAQPVNLLSNSGFEQANANSLPAEWFPFGSSQTGNFARSGSVAVKVKNGGCFIQRLPITAEKLYTLSHWSRADRAGQNARLQINWLDKDLKLIDASIQVVPATADWKRHRMSVTAPRGAVFAQIYASAHETDEVWFDDFEFVSGTFF